MAVIKKLGDRVEKDHNQFLRDSQRIEDRSATAANGPTDGLTPRGGMDFETLVGGSGATSIKADTELNGNWEDDVWGSILSSGGTEVRVLLPTREKGIADFCHASQSPSISQTTFVTPVSAPSHTTQALQSSPRIGAPLGALTLTPRTNTGNNGLRVPATIPPPSLGSSTLASTSSRAISPPAQNIQPKYQGSPLLSSQSPSQPPQRSTLSKANYNISLSDVVTNPVQSPSLTAPLMAPPSQMNQSHTPMISALSAPLVPPAFVAPRGMGDILTPLKPQQRPVGVGTSRQASKDILSDFDPLA